MKQSSLLAFAALVVVGVQGCTSRAAAPQYAVHSKLKVENEARGQANIPQLGEIDYAAEAAVSEGCVKAWRMALAKDEKGAFAELDRLGKIYPNMATVNFMRGQILEHLGRGKEAVTFYEKAVSTSEFSSMSIFKLAEAYRTSGNPDKAIPQYRKLLKSAPEFPYAKIGLASALYATDKSSQEARSLLNEVLALESSTDNADAKKKAKEALGKMTDSHPGKNEQQPTRDGK